MTLTELSTLARALWPLWLTIVFLAIVAWALWPSHRRRFDAAARIPLDDER